MQGTAEHKPFDREQLDGMLDGGPRRPSSGSSRCRAKVAGMKPWLLFATTNAGKLRELRGLRGRARWRWSALKDLPPISRARGGRLHLRGQRGAEGPRLRRGLRAAGAGGRLGPVRGRPGRRPGVHSARYVRGPTRPAVRRKLLCASSGRARRDAHGAPSSAPSPGDAGRTTSHRRWASCEGRIAPRAAGRARLRLRPDLLRPVAGQDAGGADAGGEGAASPTAGDAMRKMRP